ncbi:MAG: UvrB/UvrC motif-containing protein [Candidatus Nomurabacteria bacterium]|jgi:excinuclease ABC subunit C|nr:UvrB/UvrC motif-containing protein [Candidatus Nomurabacteria bacterium]
MSDESLLERLGKLGLPSEPGVYFHHDKNGKIIYIGKAANLKNRVSSYYRNSKTRDAKTRALVADIANTTWRTTESELDALFLESELVKRYHPKYNILLQDDKSAIYVRVGAEAVPYIALVHIPLDDGAKYFGPYYAKLPIKKALKALRRVFPFYDRPYDGKRNLYSQLKLTPALELARDTAEYKERLKLYKVNLRTLQKVLAGKREDVEKVLRHEMAEASEAQNFERAAQLRNQIYGLGALTQKMIFAGDEFVELSADPALLELARVLQMEPPRRIEGYDISHQQGTNVVGSCVVFKNGVASRADYRMFKLHNQKNDDFANMREVITRRLKHLEDWGKPDLVIIDGGIGQLTAVEDLLMAAGIRVAGWNKSSRELIVANEQGFHRTAKLAESSHAYKLIVRIDDEAHRFAVNYHTKLKRKSMLK